MRKLTILGATGSIGQSTLAVAARNTDRIEIFALTAHTNVDQMFSLCQQWQPRYVAMSDVHAAKQLRILLKQSALNIEVLEGAAGVCELATHPDVDVVMAAIVGGAGLLPTMAAVKSNKQVLLANKEALVMSGQIFIDALQSSKATLLPVDSEHNAIFQCLSSKEQMHIGHCDLAGAGISKILLTGSGGPFRYTDIENLRTVTPEQAIAHPNWSMGPKISIDSATMMNKGLEYIEARWLFNASAAQLDVIIHPQSIIHSMVQYRDGSVLAQMGQPDMCTPIASALAYPDRIDAGVAPLNFFELGELTFLAPDFQRYPCLKLAMDACFQGQWATTGLNAANEVAVAAFLTQRIEFMQIATICEQVIQGMDVAEPKHLDDLLDIDRQARAQAEHWVKRMKKC